MQISYLSAPTHMGIITLSLLPSSSLVAMMEMAVKAQPTPEKSWAGVTKECGWWTRMGGRSSSHWQLDSEVSISAQMVVARERFAATVSQVSGSMLACVKDVLNWSLRRHIGLPRSLLPLVRVSRQDDTWESSGKHSEHVTHLAEVMLKDGRLNAGERYLREDLIVGDTVFLTDVKDSLELRMLELFQMFNVLMIQNPRLASVQEGGEEDHSPEDHDFLFYGDILLTLSLKKKKKRMLLLWIYNHL